MKRMGPKYYILLKFAHASNSRLLKDSALGRSARFMRSTEPYNWVSVSGEWVHVLLALALTFTLTLTLVLPLRFRRWSAARNSTRSNSPVFLCFRFPTCKLFFLKDDFFHLCFAKAVFFLADTTSRNDHRHCKCSHACVCMEFVCEFCLLFV